MCILHRSKDKKLSKKPRTEVLPFDEKTWSVVKSAATNRRKKPQFRTSVYYDVVIVQVMNRFGHCVNYSCLEELETATAEALKDREKACPEDTIAGLSMGLAFDNFDELTQTLSGSGTLHDTMGILYQNIPVENQVSSGRDQSIVATSDDGIGKTQQV